MHGGSRRGYTLDELAELSGVPARTIRFYRQSGLVGPPDRDGRRAVYRPEHLERLRTIAELRERGFGLDAIATILDDPDRARADLPRVLRMSDELRRPWLDDREVVMTELELLEVLGTQQRSVIDMLIKWEFVTPTGDTSPQGYHVPSVATLELLGEVLAAGIDDELAYESYRAIREHLSALACELVALYTSTPVAARAAEVTLDELGATFDRLRPLALRAVQLAFARQIEQAVARFVEQGGPLDIPTRDAPV